MAYRAVLLNLLSGKRHMQLTKYEQRILSEIDEFKNPNPSLFGKIKEAVNKPLDVAADFAMDNAVGEAVSKAFIGILELLNDASSFTVRDQAIFKEFREDGHGGVRSHDDIFNLQLKHVDKTVGYLGAKYKALAAGEGVAAGMGGAAGLAVDIPAFLGLALRAVSEYATYYGFDVGIEGERIFAMKILTLASSPTVAAKQAALAQLTKVSVMVAKKKTWKELEKFVSVKAVKKIAEMLGIRLTKAKLAQVVPVIGAGVGGGYNAWYMAAVTKSAHLMYRERFLIERYGPDVAVNVR